MDGETFSKKAFEREVKVRKKLDCVLCRLPWGSAVAGEEETASNEKCKNLKFTDART